MKRSSLLPLTLIAATTMSAASQLIFIGTSTPKDGASRGIYSVRLDPVTGALSEPLLAAEAASPTFLAFHPNGCVLYALGESPGSDGKPGGAVRAFAYVPASGALTTLNTQPAGGAGTTHLAADATGRMLVTVSYGGGYVASFPLAADGRIGERTMFIAHSGPLGPNKVRQEKPHPHSVTFSPDNRFAFVADLGLDRVLIYKVDPAAAMLTQVDYLMSAPGAGPRHSKFSNDGQFFYALNEINGTIGVYSSDPEIDARAPRQIVSTLPAGFVVTDPDRAAEIRLHPNGQFVYASNRGHDSLAVFARSPADGTLTRVEIVPCGGGHPRNFAFSPDGAWLVCANRDSNNLTVFKVDPTTGRLTRTGGTASVPSPTCVLFCN